VGLVDLILYYVRNLEPDKMCHRAGIVVVPMDQSRKRAREGEEGDADEPWQRPPGVFELPWLKCRGGWELRDVFFRSLVDGRAAAIGIPGDEQADAVRRRGGLARRRRRRRGGPVLALRPRGGPGPPRDAKTRTGWPAGAPRDPTAR
jgi:hypothetical protein